MRRISHNRLAGAKQRRRGCLPVVAIVALPVAAILIFLFYLGLKGLRVENNFQNGLSQFNSGARQVGKSDELTDKLYKLNAKEDRRQTVNSISRSLDQSAKKFTLATRDFKRMKKTATFLWETKTADLMLKSTSEARKSLKLTKSLITSTDEMADDLGEIARGAGKFQQAVNNANKLIALNNSGRYADVISAAPRISATFSEAVDIINNVNSNNPGLGLSDYSAQISQGVTLTDKLKLMAESGLQNQPVQYGKLRDEANILMGRIMKVSKSKIIADPGGWVNRQLEEVKSKIISRQKNSKIFKKKALDLWEKNT